MIPARPGLVANYKRQRTDSTGAKGKPWWEPRPIEGWSDDGVPLVLDRYGQLEDARRIEGYEGIDQSGTDIVALIPAGGWRVEFSTEDGTFSEPLVGWALRSDGSVVALATDSTGEVEDLEGYADKPRIFHPGTTLRPPISADAELSGSSGSSGRPTNKGGDA